MLKKGTKIRIRQNGTEEIKILEEDVELTVIHVDDRPFKVINGYFIGDEAIPKNCIDILEEME